MTMNNIEIRFDYLPGRMDSTAYEIKEIDEVLIGDWFHLERMEGKNKRNWCLIITDEKGKQLNITINEKDGNVSNAFIFENEWEKKMNEWGVK